MGQILCQSPYHHLLCPPLVQVPCMYYVHALRVRDGGGHVDTLYMCYKNVVRRVFHPQTFGMKIHFARWLAEVPRVLEHQPNKLTLIRIYPPPPPGGLRQASVMGAVLRAGP